MTSKIALVITLCGAVLACANAGMTERGDDAGAAGAGAGQDAASGFDAAGAAGTAGANAGTTRTGGAAGTITGTAGVGGATGTGAGVAGSGGGSGSSSVAGGAGSVATAGRGGAGGVVGAGGAATGTAGTGPAPTTVVVAGPVINVDFDMQGRPTTEVSEVGYLAWPVTAAATITNASQGITFTLTRAGSNGTGLKSDWQKLAVQSPNYARLVGDGVTVDGGDAGGQIQLTIRGLSAGPHSLLAYLNQTANVASVAPVDILVNGTVKAMGVVPSIQALTNAAARTAYLTFDAQANQDVVILFRAQTSSSAVNKNVMLNGFDLERSEPGRSGDQPEAGQRRRARRLRHGQRDAVVEGRDGRRVARRLRQRQPRGAASPRRARRRCSEATRRRPASR